jgi:hypothetical protein
VADPLIERLRESAREFPQSDWGAEAAEAADEIERLRTELAARVSADDQAREREVALYAALHDIAERCRVICESLRHSHHAAAGNRGPFA